MTKARIALTSVLRRLGAGRRVRARATKGTGLSKIRFSQADAARRDSRRVIAPVSFAATLSLALLTFTPTALANTAHGFSTSFGAPGTGAGQLQLTAPKFVTNQFGGVSLEAGGSGVAVNLGNGDVYVADTGNRRVDEFDPSKPVAEQFVRAWGWGVGGGIGFETCTTLCNAGLSGSNPGEFEAPTFIAVDNSGGESAGDVYVADAATHLVQKFTSTGTLVSSWGDSTPAANGQLAGKNAREGSFGAIEGIAVDTAGHLRVLAKREYMYEYGQEGVPIAAGEFETSVMAPSGVAVDASEDLYVAPQNGNEPSVDKLSSSGQQLSSLRTSAIATGIAVDQVTGDLYVDLEGEVQHYNTSDVEVEHFGAAQLSEGAGLAVADPGSGASTVYAADPGGGRIDVFPTELIAITGPASNVTAGSATVGGSVNPLGSEVTDCHVEYGTSTEYGQSVPCGTAVGSGDSPVPVQARLEGLQGGVTYHYRVVAKTGLATVYGEDATFATLQTAVIEAAAAGGVTAESAQLTAQVNPKGVEVTSCEFEYGTSTTYGEVPVACTPAAGQIGNGTEPVTVSAQLAGLHEGTTYHWRLLVGDGNGVTTGADHTFFYPTTEEGLPDGREYEMVTPPQKNGALIGATATGGISPQESADGTRVLAESIQCLAGSQSCIGDRQSQGEPYEFVRTSTGWVTRPLAPPATELAGNTTSLFNADSGTVLYQAPNPSPQYHGRDDFYARSAAGVFSDIGPAAPESDVSKPIAHQRAATADLSHVLYEGGELGIESPIWPGDTTLDNQPTLYEYEGTGGDEPVLVGVKNVGSLREIASREGKAHVNEAAELESVCGTQLGAQPSDQYGALSEDGETVYFTALGHDNPLCPKSAVAPPATRLYVRYEHARTEPVSVPAPAGEACDAACRAQPAGDARFEDASGDGSRVFFADTQQLTDSASEDDHKSDTATGPAGCSRTAAGFSGCNLYESICPDRCAVAGSRELVDVSAADTSGLGPRVQGVMATSNDGSHAYFVALGVLTSTPNSQGQQPQNGLPNVYMYERDASAPAGRLVFVATMAGIDHEEWEEGGVNVTPDGQFLVFTSHRALTSDDPRAEGPAQVYRYDAGSGGVGSLMRVSIGEQGFNDNGNAGVLGGPVSREGYSGDARIVPAYVSTENGSVGLRRQDPTMSDDGEYVFFQSPVGLTPRALNDVQVAIVVLEDGLHVTQYAQNVYEYHEGHVSLLSDGRDGNTGGGDICGHLSAVCLLGSDASGHNVFFTTADPLVPADTDTQLDIYDARICEPSSPCIQPAPAPSPPCNEEACHGTPATVLGAQSGGTLTFNGAGNLITPPAVVKPKSLTRAQKLANALKGCKKDKKKAKRKACEKSARKKYGAVKKSSKKKGK